MGAIQPKVGEPVSDELALVESAKAGDVTAFEELVRRYDRNVFRIAQHITQNREDAEDVVQDAFIKAYKNLQQFQGQSKFYTWLVRIAVNEALMKLRRRRPERTVSLDEDVRTEDDSVPREVADWSPNPEQQYSQAELLLRIRAPIRNLAWDRIVFRSYIFIQRNCSLWTAAPQLHQRFVDCNSHQPGVKFRLPLKLLQVLVCLNEGVLNHVFCIFAVLRYVLRDAENVPVIATD